MLDTQELATTLSALLLWSEEINSRENETARHYLKSVQMTRIEPLNVREIQRLAARLRRSHRSK